MGSKTPIAHDSSLILDLSFILSVIGRRFSEPPYLCVWLIPNPIDQNPCAVAQGLFWAGVAATFAMVLGTAITVAVLASLALGSRELALKLGGASSAWANAVWTLCALGGSTLILLFGAILFASSLGPARPF